ncbi:MAG: DUF4232 domain-containing protein [Propionibacterium sp.]|nr:DUF4232 domain-containing protein [Propionibacterium sp.]
MTTHRLQGRGNASMAVALATLAILAGCAPPSNSPSSPADTAATTPTNTSSGASTPPQSPSTPASSTTSGSSATSASGGTSKCRSADLKLTLGPTNGTAGTIYTAVQFTNTGTHACLMVGFPGVSYVSSESGSQVGAAATRDGSPGPAVVLQPGQMASSIVGMVDVGVFSTASCQPTPVAGLRVYPPDETVSMFVAHAGTGCAGSPPDPQLTVRTMKAGPGTP